MCDQLINTLPDYDQYIHIINILSQNPSECSINEDTVYIKDIIGIDRIPNTVNLTLVSSLGINIPNKYINIIIDYNDSIFPIIKPSLIYNKLIQYFATQLCIDFEIVSVCSSSIILKPNDPAKFQLVKSAGLLGTISDTTPLKLVHTWYGFPDDENLAIYYPNNIYPKLWEHHRGNSLRFTLAKFVLNRLIGSDVTNIVNGYISECKLIDEMYHDFLKM